MLIHKRGFHGFMTMESTDSLFDSGLNITSLLILVTALSFLLTFFNKGCHLKISWSTMTSLKCAIWAPTVPLVWPPTIGRDVLRMVPGYEVHLLVAAATFSILFPQILSTGIVFYTCTKWIVTDRNSEDSHKKIQSVVFKYERMMKKLVPINWLWYVVCL